MQRLPRPSDYGRASVFLASDDAAMITGTDLRVDAGAIAKYRGPLTRVPLTPRNSRRRPHGRRPS